MSDPFVGSKKRKKPVKRRVGRPFKNGVSKAEKPIQLVKRSVGRPFKNGVSRAEKPIQLVKRPRGRPFKNGVSRAERPIQLVKRPRGRPFKYMGNKATYNASNINKSIEAVKQTRTGDVERDIVTQQKEHTIYLEGEQQS